jgi:hypothetical protein
MVFEFAIIVSAVIDVRCVPYIRVIHSDNSLIHNYCTNTVSWYSWYSIPCIRMYYEKAGFAFAVIVIGGIRFRGYWHSRLSKFVIFVFAVIDICGSCNAFAVIVIRGIRFRCYRHSLLAVIDIRYIRFDGNRRSLYSFSRHLLYLFSR